MACCPPLFFFLPDRLQTVVVVRSTVSSFMSSRVADAAFEICMQMMRQSLEEAEVCLGKLVVASAAGVGRHDLLLEIGRLDVLIRQKVSKESGGRVLFCVLTRCVGCRWTRCSRCLSRSPMTLRQ